MAIREDRTVLLMIQLIALLATLPFIQLGSTYYLSVAGLGSVWLIAIPQNLRLLFRANLVPRTISVVLMLLSTLLFSEVDSEDMLRACREGVFLFLITGSVAWQFSRSNFVAARAVNFTLVLLASLLPLTIAQAIFYQGGIYFGIPAEFFVQNANTLPGYLDLIYSKLRPAATFGEPSYLGGVCLSLLFAVSPGFSSSLKAKWVAGLAIATIAVSASLSALLNAIVFLSYCFLRQNRGPAKYFLFPSAIVCVGLALVFLDTSLLDRLANLGTQRELSGMLRLIVPLKIIPSVILEHPFGIPFLHFAKMDIPEVGTIGLEVLHNGLLNLIINFGLFGFFVAFTYLGSARDGYMRVFFLLISMQNGALFAPDKFFIIALSVMIYNSFAAVKRTRARDVRPPSRGIPAVGALRSARLLSIGTVAFLVALSLSSNVRASDVRDYTIITGADQYHLSTLSDALAKVHLLRSSNNVDQVRLVLPPGPLRLDRPIQLTAEYSGQPGGEFIIEGSQGTPTSLEGSTPITATLASLQRRTVMGKYSHLPALEISTRAPIAARKYDLSADSKFDLYEGRRTLRLSRWPDHTFTTSIRLLKRAEDGTAQLRFPNFPSSIVNEPSPWIGGYWTNDWGYETVPAAAANAAGLFTVGPNAPSLGRRPRLFVENTFSNLHEPGTYALNEAEGFALLLPFGDNANLETSNSSSLLVIDNAHDIIIKNIILEKTLSDTVRIIDSRNISLTDCYVGQAGSTGIVVEGGSNVSISGCVVADTSEGGVRITGGNRTTLESAHHSIRDTIITRYGQLGRDYKAGVRLEGVGITVEHCKIFGGFASAIILAGNDHVVDQNEIFDVLPDSDDAGAIYMGRDWTQRGIRIRSNYLHDIGFNQSKSSIVGIYLDDLFSGALIEGNVLDKVNRPILLGGGRDNIIHDNLVIEPEKVAFTVDSRGLQKGWDLVREEVLNKFLRTPRSETIWRERFPEITDLLSQDPFAPTGNSIARNIVLNGALGSLLGHLPDSTVGENQQLWISQERLAELRSCLKLRDKCKIDSSAVVQGLGIFGRPTPKFASFLN